MKTRNERGGAACTVLGPSFLTFYSVWAPNPGDDATHIQNESSFISKPRSQTHLKAHLSNLLCDFECSQLVKTDFTISLKEECTLRLRNT